MHLPAARLAVAPLLAALVAAAPSAGRAQQTAPAAKSDAAGEAATAVPRPADLAERAPDAFKVKLQTTKGDVILEVRREWAPHGADRFYNLVKAGYYREIAFFRVIAGFMAQFGIHGDPAFNAVWREASIPDDPVVLSNTRGTVSFATRGPNTRTTQLFINFGDNANLDGMGFSPFAKVVEGMDVVDSLHSGYGEGAPRGAGPAQGRFQSQGNAYLRAEFPKLDWLVSATIVE